jgi:GNAT superfamily N-acetyltransferase
MLHSDALLARRLEAAEAANARGCMGTHPDSATLEIAGGCAVFCGAGSPLTHAVGIGLSAPVTSAELDAIESFFRIRYAPVTFDLCPFADPALLPQLAARGYRLTEFNNVMVRRMQSAEITLTPRVRRIQPDETDLWSHTVGAGFFEQPTLTTEEMDVGRAICAMPGALCYLAATVSGTAAGGGALAIHSGLAALFADSTLTQHRGHGLHRELIAARLNEALAQGCDMATAGTLPGSISQRNYERQGFQVVYTKATLVG